MAEIARKCQAMFMCCAGGRRDDVSKNDRDAGPPPAGAEADGESPSRNRWSWRTRADADVEEDVKNVLEGYIKTIEAREAQLAAKIGELQAAREELGTTKQQLADAIVERDELARRVQLLRLTSAPSVISRLDVARSDGLREVLTEIRSEGLSTGSSTPVTPLRTPDTDSARTGTPATPLRTRTPDSARAAFEGAPLLPPSSFFAK